MAPVVSLPYIINEAGIQLVTKDDREVVDPNLENYWEQKIITRESAAPGMRTESQHHMSIDKQRFAYPSNVPQGETPYPLQNRSQNKR